MTSIIENLTKAPSQVLVNSATTFGENAAKIISAHAENAIKSSTDHLSREVKESSERLTSALTTGLSSFGDIFHRTGVEAFTEWGIGIERAFLHLGHKMEMGLSNGAQRLAAGVGESLDDNVSQLNNTLAQSSQTIAESMSTFGVIQAKEIHHEFRWEIIVLVSCAVTIAFSTVVFALTLFSRSEILKLIIQMCSQNIASVTFLLLCVLIGFLAALYYTNVQPRRSVSHSSEKVIAPAKMKHPASLVFLVGAIGFAIGQMSNFVFTSPSFGIFLSFIVMIAAAFVTFYAFTIDLFSKVYAVYRTILEFKDFYAKRKIDKQEQIDANPESPPTEQTTVKQMDTLNKVKDDDTPKIERVDTEHVSKKPAQSIFDDDSSTSSSS